MFSDTHFHYQTMILKGDVDGVSVLEKMAERNCKFGLDIGTKADDLQSRQNSIETDIKKIKNDDFQKKVRDFLYFSAGIWPDVDSIHNRKEKVEILEKCIKEVENPENQNFLHKKIIAIGEGGIDHHWNPSGADGRCENDFDKETFYGEKELFEIQLDLAKKMDLPFICHSRDGFSDTVECIKKSKYEKGIIHCFSYGLEEAKVFLDLGWYISLSGSVTYTKKSKMEDIEKLIRYIPQERLLLETDSPYLSPVPLRGKTNTPVNVEHTYRFVAEKRGISEETLSEIVDKNVDELFWGR